MAPLFFSGYTASRAPLAFSFATRARIDNQVQASPMQQKTLHERFSGPVAKVVLGIIGVVFGGFFGIPAYNSFTATHVARVDGHEITQQEFRERFDQTRSQMQRMMGAQFDALAFDKPERKREV